MKLNDKIFELRKEKGLSQEQPAEKIGVSRQTISKWETGETQPDLDNLKKLAEELSFSIDELLDIDTFNEGTLEYALVWGCTLIGLGLDVAFDSMEFALGGWAVGFGISEIMKGVKKNKQK